MKRISHKLDLTELNQFLPCKTPDQWVQHALEHLDILLIDHAHCEKKAAATAMSLMYRYPNHTDFITQLSKLAREELRHFEQVLKILNKKNIPYKTLSASRYASGLHKHVKANSQNNEKLIDLCIIGSLIEARSCERFSAIAPYLDDELKSFYIGLLASEARHFKLYLNYAEKLVQKTKIISIEDFEARVKHFQEIERELIQSPDHQFRFHSGVPDL